MNYQNKYNNFKAEIMTQLRQLLSEKGYDREKDWVEVDEDGCFNDERYDNIASTLLGDDEDGFYPYYIVKWDGESFLGNNNEDMDYWFEIEEFDLFTLCQIADYINEQN